MKITVNYVDQNNKNHKMTFTDAKSVQDAKRRAHEYLALICDEEGWDINDFTLSTVEIEDTPNPEYQEYLKTGLNDPRD